MQANFEFCDARAREAASRAEEASLDNVRDQALRAEAAWRELANKQDAVRKAREARLAENAEAAAGE